MAYKVLNGYRDIEILMDGVDDLKDLPINCPVGSIAYTADQSMKATLSPSKVWVQHKTKVSGGAAEKEMVEKVLFDQSVELIERDGKYALEGMLGISAAFVPGQTYKVEIEGESFECVAKELNVFGGTASYIGNAANLSNPDTGESFGDDTGEPFTVVTMSMDGAVAIVITIAAPATYLAYITRTFHVKITTMEEKSEVVDRLSIGFFRIEGEIHCSVTYAEIKDAITEAVAPVMSGDLTKLGHLPTAVLFAPNNFDQVLYSTGVDFHYMRILGMATFDSVNPYVEFIFNHDGITKSVVMYEDGYIEFYGGEGQ